MSLIRLVLDDRFLNAFIVILLAAIVYVVANRPPRARATRFLLTWSGRTRCRRGERP